MKKASKVWKFIYYCVFLVSVMLIILSGRGELWFDEVVSVNLVQSLDSPIEIFTKLQHDNNHILNSFYLYFIGRPNQEILYRLLSIVFGIGAIYFMSRIGARFGQVERFLAVLFAGFSFLFVLYFSEARGYAGAIFFSAFTLDMFIELRKKFSRPKLALFWLGCIGGLLAHLTYVTVLFSLICYCIIDELRERRSVREVFKTTMIFYLVPVLFFCIFYLTYIRHIIIGGGSNYPVWESVSHISAQALGLTVTETTKLIAAISVIVVITLALIVLICAKKWIWIFFPFSLFIAPAVLLIATRPEFLYPRYFILCIPFFYLLAVLAMGFVFRRSTAGKVIVISLVTLFLIFQSMSIAALLHYGRSGYERVLLKLAEQTDGSGIIVGSDHDFRHYIMLKFYSRSLPNSKKLIYIDAQNANNIKTQWLIVHHPDLSYKPPEKLTAADGRVYNLAFTDRYCGGSGWNLFIYKLQQ